MVHVLRGLAAAMCVCAAPSLAAIDCDRVRELALQSGNYAVIAYVDAAESASPAFDRMRRNVQTRVLSEYLKSLDVKSPLAAQLVFVICQKPRPKIEREDIKTLMGVPVSLALSRILEGSSVMFVQAVIPQIDRKNPPDTSDLDVFAVDASASDRSASGWEATILANSGSLKALLGLALAVHHLQAKDGPTAKLLLCKSRRDLRLASGLRDDSPQSAQQLLDFIDELLKETEPLVASVSTRIDAKLRQRIELACAAD